MVKSMIMKRNLFLVFLFAVCLLIGSCNKKFSDSLVPDRMAKIEEDPKFIETAKQYYQTELEEQMRTGMYAKFTKSVSAKQEEKMSAEVYTKLAEKSVPQKAGTNDTSRKTVEPKIYVTWKKAYTSAYGQRKILEVPIRGSHRIVSLLKISRDSLGYTPDRTMLKTIFDRLIITRQNGQAEFQSKVVRYHPDRPYLEKYNYDLNHLHLYNLGDYTGYLEYMTTGGERRGIVRVVDGGPVRRYKSKGKSRSTQQDSKGMSPATEKVGIKF